MQISCYEMSVVPGSGVLQGLCTVVPRSDSEICPRSGDVTREAQQCFF